MESLDDINEWQDPLFEDSFCGKLPWEMVSIQVDAAGLSDRGRVRPNNEDHFLIARFGRFLEAMQSSMPLEDVPNRHDLIGHAFLVADGMGGHAAGEIASKSAINVLLNLVTESPDWILRPVDSGYSEEVGRRAALRMAQTSQSMVRQADANPSLRGFGTTLTIAWGVGVKWFVAHVGDSRAYRYRDGELNQLTRDHTLAQDMADKGIIPQQQVHLHRFRHHLTRLLGDKIDNVDPQVLTFDVRDGDTLLLCTDGLTEMVSRDAIASIVDAEQSADGSCRQLVDAALSAGGVDNITAIVARFRR